MYYMVTHTATDTAHVEQTAQALYLEELEILQEKNHTEADATEIAKVHQLLLYLRDVYLGNKACVRTSGNI